MSSARRLRLPAGAEGRAFVIAFVVMLGVAWLAGPKPFHYDSGGYWRLADTFTKDGSFSLLNFDDGLRGFMPSILYGGLREVAYLFGDGQGPASAVVKVFNAALFAAIATVLLPRLGMRAWPGMQVGLLRRLGLAALFLVFWRGYLNFPLTDAPALALGLVAILAASGSARLLPLLLAGLAAGVAIDFRPAYVLLAPAVIALAWAARRRSEPGSANPRRHVVAGATAVVIGIAGIAVPQTLITHENFGVWSPLPGAGANLTSFQLSVGLKLQRYETFVGPNRNPQLNYFDPNTKALDDDLGPTGTVEGYADYLELMVRHPTVMGGVFVRHFINGIDQRYSTPYIEELDTGGQRPLRTAGFVLIFLGLLRLGWPAARRGLGTTMRWGPLVALTLTCATTLPSAMETRFLMPVFGLAALLALAPGWPGLRATVLDRRGLRANVRVAVILLSFAAWMALCFVVTSGATENLAPGA